jgi:hypothetical protein
MNFTVHSMVRRVGAILMMTATLVSSVPPASAQSTWRQREFVIGVFFDPPFDPEGRQFQRDVARFRAARQAGITLLSGTQGDGAINHTWPGMEYALRLSAAAGLHYLASDYRYYEAYDKDWSNETGAAVVRDFKGLPDSLRRALYGYMLADEPRYRPDHQRRVTAWVRYMQEQDPEKLSYVTLAPSYAVDANWEGFTAGNQDLNLDEAERRQYEEYLSMYVDRASPAVLCFDNYPFFRDGNFRRDYFYNLEVIRQLAGTRPMWACPLANDHATYADPTVAQMRFMYFAPMAYGAKGLMIFSYAHLPYEGYRSAMLDGQGRSTRKHDAIRALNLYVTRVAGPVLMSTSCAGVYHASNFPREQQHIPVGIPADAPVVSAISDPQVMVGVLESDTSRYLMVVNKSVQSRTGVDIAVKGSVPVVTLAPRVQGFTAATSPAFTRTATTVSGGSSPVTTIRIPTMAGGEGRLVRIR